MRGFCIQSMMADRNGSYFFWSLVDLCYGVKLKKIWKMGTLNREVVRLLSPKYGKSS